MLSGSYHPQPSSLRRANPWPSQCRRMSSAQISRESACIAYWRICEVDSSLGPSAVFELNCCEGRGDA